MKHLFILLLLATSVQAQSDLKFDKRFVQSEDKWVAFEANKDTSYTFGFIYIDSQAGLTLQVEGDFKINKQGKYIPKKLETNMKARLQPNSVQVAFIPETRFEELKITAAPEWLKYYKTDVDSIARMFHWGFMYNGWDECEKALTFLEKAQAIDPKYKGLAVELAYSYNALKQYDKAINVLEGALETSPDQCYLYKELSYAELHFDQLSKAEETYRKGISICTDKAMKCEMAWNIAAQYFREKDKEHFQEWAKETEKYTSKGDQFSASLKKMKKEIDN